MNEELKIKVYNKIKSILKKHKGVLTAKKDVKGDYQLYSIKKIEVLNKVVDEMYFAGVTVKKNDVRFYFFPLYTHLKEFRLTPSLKKRLKGKTCFQINKLDEELMNDISLLIKKGYEVYRKVKWI